MQNAEQQKEQEQLIKEITQKLRDKWSVQKVWSQYEEKQEIYATKKFESIESFKCTFQCTISQTSVNYPVFLSGCVIEGELKHFEDYYDLEGIVGYLISNKLIDKRNPLKLVNLYKCPHCQSLIMHDDLDLALQPHVFMYNLRKQCGQVAKTIYYYPKRKLIIPEYSNKQYQDFFIDRQKIILEIMESKDEYHNFLTLADRKKECHSLDLPVVCKLGLSKVVIPVRGKLCNHYDVYDLVILLKYLTEQSNTYQCQVQGCNQEFKFKERNQLLIDWDLYNLGLKSLSFSFYIKYHQQTKRLEDKYTTEKDATINSYKHNRNNDILYLRNIYEITERAFVNPDNIKLTTKFYEDQPINSWSNRNDDIFKSKISQTIIELPARCIRCKDISVCDLRYYACIWNQSKTKDPGVAPGQIVDRCPLCNTQFTKNPPQFFKQVYVDTNLLKYILSTNIFNRSLKNFALFQNPTKALEVTTFIQQDVKPETNNIQLEKKRVPPYSKLAISMISLFCLITNNKLAIPIRTQNCNHSDAFDFDSVKNLDLTNVPCPKCKSLIGNIKNCYIDEWLQIKLVELNSQNPQAKTAALMYASGQIKGI